MKKTLKTIISLFGIALILFLSACGAAQIGSSMNVPSISADYIYLASEGVYMDIFKGTSGHFLVPLISGSPLSEEDIRVELNTDIRMEIGFDRFGLPDQVEMPFYVYQCYRGKDWESYAQMQASYQEMLNGLSFEDTGKAEEAADALEASQNEFLPDYLELREQGRLPVLYRYMLSVRLLTDGQPLQTETLSEITLYVHGKKLTFPLGRIHMDAETAWPGEENPALISERGLASSMCIQPSADGLFSLSDGFDICLLKAAQDLEITGLRLFNDDRQLVKVQAVVFNTAQENENGGIAVNENGEDIVPEILADFLWDRQEPISLSAGQRVYFNFTFRDAALANRLSGYTQLHLEVCYRTTDGKTRSILQWYPLRIETVSCDPHEIYLAHELGVDIMSYYNDFFYPLNETTGIIQF